MLWWILVGLVAGWATGKLVRGEGYGPLTDITLGIVGALLGGFLMRLVGFAGRGGFLYTVFVAIVGAVVLTWIGRALFGRQPHVG